MESRAKQIVAAVVIFLIIFIFVVALGFADNGELDVWAICQPGHSVIVRDEPSDDAECTAWYRVTDLIRIDGLIKNGYAHCEKGWISVRCIVTDKPEWENGRWYAVNEDAVAWIGSEAKQPCIIYGGTMVQVFWHSADWCVTNRGMIRTNDLEEELCQICNN